MSSSKPTRLAIIGDISGHMSMLSEQLLSLGVDLETLAIRSDLVICQVGDLVHKGPDSNAIVNLVDRLMAANPDNWVQLVGNHEAQYLDDQPYFWTPQVDVHSTDAIRRWWREGDMKIAAAFSVDGLLGPDRPTVGPPKGELLVTHAGLARGALMAVTAVRRKCAIDITATEVAEILNTNPGSKVWRAGTVFGYPISYDAGPIWAAANSEVYMSWIEASDPPPFHQAHGHTAVYSWRKKKVFDPLDTSVDVGLVELDLDDKRKVTKTTIKGKDFFGTDPSAARSPVSVSVPLMFRLAE